MSVIEFTFNLEDEPKILMPEERVAEQKNAAQRAPMTGRVVITGLGVISPVGKTPAEFFSNLMAGRAGIKRLQTDFVEQLSIRIGAPVDSFDPSAHFSRIQLSGIERFSQFALVAAEQAVQDAQLELTEEEQPRAGVCMGSCLERRQLTRSRLCGDAAAQTAARQTAQRAAQHEQRRRLAPLHQIHLRGANIIYSTACSSSAIAVGEAYRPIKHGYADVMLAGGSEATLTLGAMKAWEALRTLAQEDPNDAGASCKPFSMNRSGLVLGEGAAVLVLEDAERALQRGAKIYAKLVGYDCSSDSSHITKPDAAGQTRTMLKTLQRLIAPLALLIFGNRSRLAIRNFYASRSVASVLLRTSCSNSSFSSSDSP